MKFVNYKEVEKIITDVENVFNDHELDTNEKNFIINQVATRIKAVESKQTMADLVGGFSMGGLMKRAKKAAVEDEE